MGWSLEAGEAGHTCWLGVDSEGDSTLYVGHQEGLQTGGYERKADEAGEGSVQAQNTEQKSSRRPERLLPGTEVCPLGLCYPCWCLVSCFLRKTDAGSSTAQSCPALEDHSQCP